MSGHNRPINEILTPNKLDISKAYTNEFVGMTTEPVSLEALLEARDWLFETLPSSITPGERQYLRSLKIAEPDWSLLPFPGLAELPSIKWKLQNITHLKNTNTLKYKSMYDALDKKLTEIPFVTPTIQVIRSARVI